MQSTAIADPAAGTPCARPTGSSLRVHCALAGSSLVLLPFCVLAAPPGAMKSAQPLIITVLVLTAPLLIPAVLFHDRKKWRHRDGALMLPWTLLITLLIVQAAPITATFAYPLRDSLWRSFDQHLGLNVPA